MERSLKRMSCKPLKPYDDVQKKWHSFLGVGCSRLWCLNISVWTTRSQYLWLTNCNQNQICTSPLPCCESILVGNFRKHTGFQSMETDKVMSRLRKDKTECICCKTLFRAHQERYSNSGRQRKCPIEQPQQQNVNNIVFWNTMSKSLKLFWFINISTACDQFGQHLQAGLSLKMSDETEIYSPAVKVINLSKLFL